ncbi:hypothetical protein Lesp01_57850 [Lentzea sp. NBRC 102530]|nr:hypothetical protein Lesp01_57850 [Lentzea sp. NBRC 102530]
MRSGLPLPFLSLGVALLTAAALAAAVLSDPPGGGITPPPHSHPVVTPRTGTPVPPQTENPRNDLGA